MCSHFHFSERLRLLNISMGECFCWKDLDCRGPPCEPLGAFGGGVDYCSYKWRAPVTGTIFLSICAQGSGCGGKTNLIPQLQLRGRGSHFFLQTIFFSFKDGFPNDNIKPYNHIIRARRPVPCSELRAGMARLQFLLHSCSPGIDRSIISIVIFVFNIARKNLLVSILALSSLKLS